MHILDHLTLAAPPKPKPWPGDLPKRPIKDPDPRPPKDPKRAGLTRRLSVAVALTGGWTWLALRVGIAACAYVALGDPALDVQPAVAR